MICTTVSGNQNCCAYTRPEHYEYAFASAAEEGDTAAPADRFAGPYELEGFLIKWEGGMSGEHRFNGGLSWATHDTELMRS